MNARVTLDAAGAMDALTRMRLNRELNSTRADVAKLGNAGMDMVKRLRMSARINAIRTELGAKAEPAPAEETEQVAPEGRTIFDHSWVEQYYMQAIDRAAQDIDHLERQASGYGEAHRETRRKAEELAKWHV